MPKLALLGLLALAAAAEDRYETREEMIPMRDGVRLYTRICTPKDKPGPLPFLLTRTPYGIAGTPGGAFSGGYKELYDDGYIFVWQDIRGRHQSEGSFAMLRLPRDRGDARAVDEGSDAYDTIAWLLANVAGHNGRAGILGVSYPGWLALMATLDPHPALRAASPQASPADMYLGDDFHHYGAFRLSYGFEFATLLESSKSNTNFRFDIRDTFEWFLRLGPLSNVNARHFHGSLPTWNDFAAHPNYDEFWRRQAFVRYIDRVAVPTLNVAGWWDQEDFYGPMKIYEALEKFDRKRWNVLAVGPWNHGQWSRGDGRRLGKIDFGAATGTYYRERIQAPWFAHWLKDKPDPKLAEATVFESGSNRWERYDAWPPKKGAARKTLYLQAGGRLGWDRPREQDGFDEFLSDPAHPVPYRARPIGPTFGDTGWGPWQVEDQRFVYLRPDVRAWSTGALEGDVTAAGAIEARIYGSTTGTDADWIVKLIDVYPEDYAEDRALAGWQLMVAADVLRGRFRKSFERPEPATPGEAAEYRIDLLSRNHRFRKGHRIMVQVQSTWFPLIDRNPQKYVDNIFQAREEDFIPATHRVHRSAKFPSGVELQVRR